MLKIKKYISYVFGTLLTLIFNVIAVKAQPELYGIEYVEPPVNTVRGLPFLFNAIAIGVFSVIAIGIGIIVYLKRKKTIPKKTNR